MNTTESLRVTTPTPTEIVLTRTFDAPRALVFDAFTKPELIRRWLGRKGDEMTVCDVDLRVDGAYRYVWRLRDDEGEMGMGGTFREIEAPDRLVQTEAFDGYPGEAVVTTTFVEQGGRTTVTSTSAYASQEVRDALLATGMEDGVAESYDRLAELLASQR